MTSTFAVSPTVSFRAWCRTVSAARMAVAVAALCVVSGVHAGEQTGKVAMVQARSSDGLVSVELEGAHTGKPDCAKYSYWMVKAEDSGAGKRQYAALLAAKLSGKTVKLLGANTCNRWPDGEDIESVLVLD